MAVITPRSTPTSVWVQCQSGKMMPWMGKSICPIALDMSMPVPPPHPEGGEHAELTGPLHHGHEHGVDDDQRRHDQQDEVYDRVDLRGDLQPLYDGTLLRPGARLDPARDEAVQFGLDVRRQ